MQNSGGKNSGRKGSYRSIEQLKSSIQSKRSREAAERNRERLDTKKRTVDNARFEARREAEAGRKADANRRADAKESRDSSRNEYRENSRRESNAGGRAERVTQTTPISERQPNSENTSDTSSNRREVLGVSSEEVAPNTSQDSRQEIDRGEGREPRNSQINSDAAAQHRREGSETNTTGSSDERDEVGAGPEGSNTAEFRDNHQRDEQSDIDEQSPLDLNEQNPTGRFRGAPDSRLEAQENSNAGSRDLTERVTDNALPENNILRRRLQIGDYTVKGTLEENTFSIRVVDAEGRTIFNCDGNYEGDFSDVIENYISEFEGNFETGFVPLRELARRLFGPEAGNSEDLGNAGEDRRQNRSPSGNESRPEIASSNESRPEIDRATARSDRAADRPSTSNTQESQSEPQGSERQENNEQRSLTRTSLREWINEDPIDLGHGVFADIYRNGDYILYQGNPLENGASSNYYQSGTGPLGPSIETLIEGYRQNLPSEEHTECDAGSSSDRPSEAVGVNRGGVVWVEPESLPQPDPHIGELLDRYLSETARDTQASPSHGDTTASPPTMAPLHRSRLELQNLLESQLVNRLANALGRLHADLAFLIETQQNEPRYYYLRSPGEGRYNREEVVNRDGRWYDTLRERYLHPHTEVHSSDLQKMIDANLITEDSNGNLSINLGQTAEPLTNVIEIINEHFPNFLQNYEQALNQRVVENAIKEAISEVFSIALILGDLLPLLGPAVKGAFNGLRSVATLATRTLREMSIFVPGSIGSLGALFPRGLPRLVPLSDRALAQRASDLHRAIAAEELRAAGREVTDDAIKRTLRWGTISIVETETAQGMARIITTNRPQFQRILDTPNSTLLQPGEILGSRITRVYGPSGRQQQFIHAEQLGLNDAVSIGGTGGRVASSNPGCTELCVSLITEFFPQFRHVNPVN